MAAEVLGRPRVEGKAPALLLQDCLELAHLATQACALSQDEEGFATYDELLSTGPVDLNVGTKPRATRSGSPFLTRRPVSSTSVIKHYIGTLAGSRSSEQRQQMLQMVANQIDLVPDLDAESGALLAQYLMKLKPDEREHQQMLKHAKRLASWRTVRLGLADQLARVSGRDDQLRELFVEVLGEPVNLGNEAERAKLRYRLMAQVAEELAREPESLEPKEDEAPFDIGKAELAKLAARQGQLLGLPVDHEQGVPLSSVVQSMLPPMADRLNPPSLAADDRQLIAQLPFTLQAIAFAAENDLQLTVLLEQLRMRLLAADVSQRQPARTAAARAVVSRFETRARTASHVMVQLHDVYEAMLELWLLYQPGDDGL